MTVDQAIAAVRAAGSIQAVAGKLTVRYASAREREIRPALDTLRQHRDTALALVEQGFNLKGHPVELWSDSLGRLFIVADDEDAELAVMRWKVSRGEIWTNAEIEFVARITDTEARREIAHFKRTLSGTVAGAQAMRSDRSGNSGAVGNVTRDGNSER